MGTVVKHMRCCMISQDQTYRGIDREVTMKVFSKAKRKEFATAFEHYLRYLSCEEEYSAENLSTMNSFSEYITCSAFGNSEIVIYSDIPIEIDNTLVFVGIDIISEHLDSVLKNRKMQLPICKINQYGLCSCEQDAAAAIAHLKQKTIYDDVYGVYVYIVTGVPHVTCVAGDSSAC